MGLSFPKINPAGGIYMFKLEIHDVDFSDFIKALDVRLKHSRAFLKSLRTISLFVFTFFDDAYATCTDNEEYTS